MKPLESVVEVFFGPLQEEHGQNIDDLVALLDIDAPSIEQMDLSTRIEVLLDNSDMLWRELQQRPGRMENLIAGLQLLLEPRFGWPEGTVQELTPRQARIALDHAIEYDSPRRPSIWGY